MIDKEIISRMTKINDGGTAEIFRYGDTVYKIYKPTAWEKLPEFEYNQYKEVSKYNVPQPKILALDTIGERKVLVMEYVPGHSLAELLFSQSEDPLEINRKTVEIQMIVHAVSDDETNLPDYRSLLENKINLSGLADDKKSELINTMYSFEYKNCLCHGDFHAGNIIETEKGPVVIDWCDACKGDEAADVCRTYVIYLGVNPQFAEHFLSLYCEKSGIDPKQVLKWKKIIAAARLSEFIPEEERRVLYEILDEE